MTWVLRSAYGGETQDALIERTSLFTVGGVTSSIAIDSTAARIATGARCIKFDAATDGANCGLNVGYSTESTSNKIVGVQMMVGAAGSFTSAAGLVSQDTEAGVRFVAVNTSGLVEVRDDSGATIITSQTAISTTGLTRVTVIFDTLSPVLGTMVNLWINGVLEGWAFHENAVLRPNMDDNLFGEIIPSGSTRGNDWYGDDLTARSSIDATADPPHLTPYPILKVVGGASLPPTGNGSHTAWTLSDGGTADYTRVDEFPNDGDTSWVGSVTNDAKETYTYSAANPLSGTETVHHVQQRVAHRLTGAKDVSDLLYRDGSANESTADLTTPGTSYNGNVGRIDYAPDTNTNASVGMTRPAGGSWVPSDFDLSAGASTLQFGGVMPPSPASPGERWTSLPGPEIVYSTENLPPGRYLFQQPLMMGGFL